MYTRGGCVWSNQEGENFVFLAKDWDGGRILEDLVEEAGLLGTSFKSLSPVKRAKFAGYVKTGNQLEFFHQQESHRNSKKIYLAGDFNKWEQAKNDPRWELQPHSEDLFVLSSSQSKILLEYGTKWTFKLITEDAEWIEPEETYPCLKKIVGVPMIIFLTQAELGVIFLHLNRLRDLKIKILKNGFLSYPKESLAIFNPKDIQTLEYLHRV